MSLLSESSHSLPPRSLLVFLLLTSSLNLKVADVSSLLSPPGHTPHAHYGPCPTAAGLQ